jgi:hypothetical protein
MAFQSGTWLKLPSNCTQDYVLTYLRCAEYGVEFFQKCIAWMEQTVISCIDGIWSTVKSCLQWAPQCCGWIPCSWVCAVIVGLVCIVMGIVVTFVCLIFGILVLVVCSVIALVEVLVCILWSLVEIIFCVSSANGGTAFLLTDGSVMMQECKSVFGVTSWPTTRWWKLTPDVTGSYANGTWSRLADSGLARKYFASSVLADGRVLVCGGEYTDAGGMGVQENYDNSCEIYDPVKNTWDGVPTPSTTAGALWTTIGDAPCSVLPDGTFLLGSSGDRSVAKLDPATLKWTAMGNRPVDPDSDEESWVLMPDNTIAAPSCTQPPLPSTATWVYDIASDTWNPGNALPVSISDAGEEIGPALLLYNATPAALFLGATQHTAFYSPGGAPAWTNGGDLPTVGGKNVGIVDGPAALLVNGNVVFGAGPIDAKGDYQGPSSFFEFDGTTFNRTSDPPNNDQATYFTRLLLLPNGDVMFCREDDSSFYAYHPAAATPFAGAAPVIVTCPANLMIGTTIQITGMQFNGLSQAVAYGDDSTTPTNYPLVRVVNTATGHVQYCRTSNHTSMGVATGQTLVTTTVTIPFSLERGPATLFVVANGIPSLPFAVQVLTGLQ